MTTIITKQERLVLDIIEDYLGNNRYFHLDKILDVIKSRFAKKSVNINNEGIRLLLKSLTNKNYIAEGSKLIKKNTSDLFTSNYLFLIFYIKLKFFSI